MLYHVVFNIAEKNPVSIQKHKGANLNFAQTRQKLTQDPQLNKYAST